MTNSRRNNSQFNSHSGRTTSGRGRGRGTARGNPGRGNHGGRGRDGRGGRGRGGRTGTGNARWRDDSYNISQEERDNIRNKHQRQRIYQQKVVAINPLIDLSPLPRFDV
jgi:hypothetical protein